MKLTPGMSFMNSGDIVFIFGVDNERIDYVFVSRGRVIVYETTPRRIAEQYLNTAYWMRLT